MQATDRPVVSAGKTYRRLLAYARPHLGIYLIGVVGMVLYAATDAAVAWFVKFFLKYSHKSYT